MKTLHVALALAALVAVAGIVRGEDPEETALLAALPKSKHSLADGIRQLTKGAEVAFSGKFEFHDGKLALSVYTAEKGLSVDPANNILKEFIGSPEGAAWTPEVEVFTDVPHVAESSMQMTLVALSAHTLIEIIAQAEKDQPGTVYSISPELRDRRGVVVVLVASEGKSVELCYDLAGKRLTK